MQDHCRRPGFFHLFDFGDILGERRSRGYQGRAQPNSEVSSGEVHNYYGAVTRKPILLANMLTEQCLALGISLQISWRLSALFCDVDITRRFFASKTNCRAFFVCEFIALSEQIVEAWKLCLNQNRGPEDLQ